MNTVREYKEKYCNNNGQIKKHNLSNIERDCLNEIKDKTKKGEITVFPTDKSGRFSVDTPENYIETLMTHTTGDVEINSEGVKIRENKINLHMRQFNRMFQVGVQHGHEERVTGATLSTNIQPPPLYGLRKDHKNAPDDFKGPPVRPVCGANSAPNSRLSHFLSKIINDYADYDQIETECRSSEEMRAAFEQYNNLDIETKKKCNIISMDVKALYPSMEWDEIVKSVKMMIEHSDLEIENVDYDEVGKYLAVTMSRGDIVKEGLQHVIPDRIGGNNRNITVNYLNDRRNDDQWIKGRVPGKRQRKKMLAFAVAEGVRTCLENHMYCVGDTKYLQMKGGPIGLELTGAVSRPFMARWDRMYKDKVNRLGIKMLLFERYVDDSNQVAITPPKGSVYNKVTDRIKIDPEKLVEDQIINDDERLAKILLDIANTVMKCVTMEGDWPSKNEDKKLPILDMKTWTDTNGSIKYQHYEKAVSSKTILNAKSAHSAACKRSVHTQEVIRRVLNCSRNLDWDNQIAPFVTEYMIRMKIAGYSETYRKTVLEHAIRILDDKWKANDDGTRPIYRPKDYKREERKANKIRKRNNWSKKGGHIAPIFIPATPGSVLLKKMRKVVEEEGKKGIKFKLLEKGGTTMKRELQRSNPTASKGCDKDDCQCCLEERGAGGQCHKENVNYIISCHLCPVENRACYVGETSKNLYTRMDQHQGAAMREGSFMRKHMEDRHRGQQNDFRARVTHSNRDCMTRQIREGILIRDNRNSLNTRSEWHLPALYRIDQEIVRD